MPCTLAGKNVRHFWDVRAGRTPLSESKLTPFLPQLPRLWTSSSNPPRRSGRDWPALQSVARFFTANPLMGLTLVVPLAAGSLYLFSRFFRS